MANRIANIARGRDVQFCLNVNAGNPANSAIGILLLKVAEDDDILADYDTIQAMLAAAGNTEADDTDNYVRKELTSSDGITVTVTDGATNNVVIDCPDIVYTALGGTTNNTIHYAIFYYDPDTATSTDADRIPMYIKEVLNEAGDATGRLTNGQNFTLGTPNGLITQ